MIRAVAVLAVLALASCGQPSNPRLRPQTMELWYWHHAYVTTPAAVAASKALVDRAVAAGYTGVAFWDSSWTFLDAPGWPAENVSKLQEVVNYAAAHGLQVMPVVAPYGHSNDLLKLHPEWAEGQRVIGTRFRVDTVGRALVHLKQPVAYRVPNEPTPLLRFSAHVAPWRQYHAHLRLRTREFHGVAQFEVNRGRTSRLDAQLNPQPDQPWTPVDYTFNSGDGSELQIAVGAFGAHAGHIEISDFSLEETALVYVIRGVGGPVRLYDPADPHTQWVEGRDFDTIQDHKLLRTPEFAHDNFHDPGPVTLPPGSRLRPGQLVALDYYAVMPVYDEAVSACLTNPAVERWAVENAQACARLVRPGSPLLLSHDEIRQMNSCALCRQRGLTAGGLLASHIQSLTARLAPLGAPLYVWSDMFDPLHNARDHYYQVEGDLSGSSKGLPPGITIMNWNLDNLRLSLLWFSGSDPRQRVPYRQIIAGFYDPADHDGAAAAHRHWAAARGLPGIVGAMYTTWVDDYSQLAAFADASREEWIRYRASRPW